VRVARRSTRGRRVAGLIDDLRGASIRSTATGRRRLLRGQLRRSGFGEPGTDVLRRLADAWGRFVEATEPELPQQVYEVAAGRLRDREW
jgi:hypothetical protein